MTAYKQTELGLIPSDWEAVELKTLLGFHEKKYKTEKYYTFIGMQDVSSDAKIINQTILPINTLKQGYIYFERDDVLVAKITPCFENGKGCYTHNLKTKIGFGSTEFHVLHINQLATANFIYYWTTNPNFRNKLAINMVGSAGHKRVPIGDILTFKIPLPPKPEQTAIATALSDTDALLAELEKLLAKKHAIKTATMQQLLTGKTRLPEFAHRADGIPKGSLKTEWGDIPEDWEVVALGDVGNTYAGLTGKNKDDFGIGNCFYVPFTNVMANIEVNINQLDKVNVNEKQNSVLKNDLLFNGSSETPEEICFSSLVNFDIPNLYLNSFCFGFRVFNLNKIHAKYLAYWFRSNIGRKTVAFMAQGSTRYNISKSEFLKLQIIVPQKPEQTAIAQILGDMDSEITALQAQIEKLREIKQGMMQNLLTGKIRLPF